MNYYYLLYSTHWKELYILILSKNQYSTIKTPLKPIGRALIRILFLSKIIADSKSDISIITLD